MKKDVSISNSFRARADSAAFWEAWVGAQLSRKGLRTVHLPFTLTSETGNPASYYANTWDLEVGRHGFTVEVKSSNLSFTLPNDYPHMGVLVCSESSYMKKWGPVTENHRDFLFVSRTTGGVIWLPIGAPVTVREVTDMKRAETYACVASGKQYLRSLDEYVAYIKEMER